MRGYTPDDINRLRQYCEEGQDLSYIAEHMQRNPGGVIGKMWKLARHDASWKPFARRYSGDYSHQLRQRPLGQEDADSLIRHLMEYPESSKEELAGAGHGKTLSLYPGGITQARADAETERFLEAYRGYNDFVSGLTRSVLGNIDSHESKELKLIHAIFGDIPSFGDISKRVDKYARLHLQRNPLQGNLEDYKSGIVASLSDLFVNAFSDGGELREIINGALETLNPRERRVLELRFLADRRYTRDEIAVEFEVTGERIGQIEDRAMRKLRHPRRAEKLTGYFQERRDKVGVPAEYRDIDVDEMQQRLEDSQGVVSGLQYEIDTLQRTLDSEQALRRRLEQLETRRKTPENGMKYAHSLSFLHLPAYEDTLLDAGIRTVGKLATTPDYELQKIVGYGVEAIRRKIEAYERARSFGIPISEEPIEALGIGNRITKALKRNQRGMLWELLLMTESEVSKLRNIGQGSLQAIKASLEGRGLSLRKD